MSMTQEEIDALISSGVDETQNEENLDSEQKAKSADTMQGDFPNLGFSSDSNILSPLDPKMELLYDLQLPVSIELGRTNMLIRDILRLGRGSVVEFDKLVSEPVDVLINGKKVAEGEVVVVDKHFGIRITTLIDPADRLKGIKK
ncbi:MAG: flagellar motor switch protein FliN [Candidatus Kapabacteria bacterium]|nr:flagellar motor switch protein FliN [Candidatus Kapabacteria bacterium]